VPREIEDDFMTREKHSVDRKLIFRSSIKKGKNEHYDDCSKSYTQPTPDLSIQKCNSKRKLLVVPGISVL